MIDFWKYIVVVSFVILALIAHSEPLLQVAHIIVQEHFFEKKKRLSNTQVLYIVIFK